ncbi:MAG: ABC transporter permease, partial [Solirubrobacteraceae bacterium]
HGIRLIAQVLPLAQGVDLCRSLSLGSASPAAAFGHAAYLLVLVLAGVTLARVNYRRRLHA